MRSGRLTGSLLVAYLAATGTAGVAHADTRKVEVVSDPPGATIYLGDLDSPEACKAAPCAVDVPAGKKTPVIAHKEGYSDQFGVIDLRKGKVVKTITLTLTSTMATLALDDPGLAGGTILVDDVDKGKAPTKLSVEVARHHVVVKVKGRIVFDDSVKLDPGEEYTVKPNRSEPAPLPPRPLAEPGGPAVATADPVDSVTKTETVAKSAGDAPREPWVTAGGVFEVGFRQFKYDHPANVAPTENEGGQVLIGPSLELWPARLVGAKHLRGLSLYAKVGFGVNHREVLQDPDATPTGDTTFWGNIEIDVQHRWNFGDSGAVLLSAGFVRDQLQYTAAMSTTQLALVPDADYMAMRIGARGILRLGAVEPYVQLEGRIPFSEGDLATRFSQADVTGAGAAVGIAATVGPIALRVEASVVYYGWSITTDTTNPMAPMADGASDLIEGVSVLVGYGY